MTIPDWLSVARLVLVAILWPAALAGEGRLVGIGMLVAGVTDALDGYLARRLGVASARGAKLDAIADASLLVSAAGWLAVVEPRLVSENAPLLVGVGLLYVASTAASWFAFRRLVDPRQLTAKLAGGFLYAFALVTLLTGIYEPLLLRLALGALAIACLESLVKASITIHASGIASTIRSQRPQAAKEV